MTFRKAAACDLSRIAEIYAEIHAGEEAGRTTTGWVRDVYPTEQTAQSAIASGDLFVEESDGQIVASGRINQEQVSEYANAAWHAAAPENEVMVLHTLTVASQIQGHGFGRAFVEFYEEYARKHGCRYLRMDTNERNLSARAMYKKLGYTEVGIVNSVFNGIAGVRLVCLEKTLEIN